MRFVVLLFGLFAAVVTAAFGDMFFAVNEVQKGLEAHDFHAFDIFFSSMGSNGGVTGLFLLIGAGFCLLGSILSMFRCGWQGSLLMIVSTVGPAVLNPMTLICMGPQIFTALISCFIRPLPLMPVSQED